MVALKRRTFVRDLNLNLHGPTGPMPGFGPLEDPKDTMPDLLYTHCDFCGRRMVPYEEPFCTVQCAVAYENELNRSGRRAA